jgi:hypothetical protein
MKALGSQLFRSSKHEWWSAPTWFVQCRRICAGPHATSTNPHKTQRVRGTGHGVPRVRIVVASIDQPWGRR